MRDAGADAADGGYLWRSMWILWITSSLSSHSTSASVSELSRLVTQTAVSLPKCKSEKRPLSNSVTFRESERYLNDTGIIGMNRYTAQHYIPVYSHSQSNMNITLLKIKVLYWHQWFHEEL